MGVQRTFLVASDRIQTCAEDQKCILESKGGMGRGRMWAERMQGGEERHGVYGEPHKSWGGLGIKHRGAGGAHRPHHGGGQPQMPGHLDVIGRQWATVEEGSSC